MEFNKRIYKPKEYFLFMDDMLYSMADLRYANQKKLISEAFMERIMLAVTEVNGCQMCSYFHAKEALKKGMTDDEIDGLLMGEEKLIPTEERSGVLFAKYYAEQAGQVEEEIWQNIVEEYGQDRAKGILGYIRIIMVGNVSGISLGAFKGRFKGERVKGSKLLNELIIILMTALMIPVIIVKQLIKKRDLFKKTIDKQ